MNDPKYAEGTYTPEPEHRFSFEDDRCVCGGVIVYFEDGDADGVVGEGCEVSERIFVGPDRCVVCGRRAILFADLDPGDPEVGPDPDVVGFCSESHRDRYLDPEDEPE